MMHRDWIIHLSLAAALLAGSFAAGCAPKFSRQKFETIYVGMPAYAVEQKLGEPQESTPALWVYTGRPYYRAEIIFRDGRVVETRWSYERPETTRPAGGS